MSIYHLVFLWLIICALVEHLKKNISKPTFYITYIILFLMLCFRFGQGQDYFSYASVFYYETPMDFLTIFQSHGRTEFGWMILNFVFRKLHFPFPVFILMISTYMMLIFLRFLRVYCWERKMLALVLCYHTLYLSYFTSGLRQGIVVVTFLGVLLPLLQKKRYSGFVAITLLLCAIHYVAAVLLVVPIFMLIPIKSKPLIGLVGLGFVIGFVLYHINFGDILYEIVPISYLLDNGISITAIFERCVSFIVVTVCYLLYQRARDGGQDPWIANLYKIYAVGIFIYGSTMWAVLFASRIIYAFKVIEVILLCRCITKCGKIWRFDTAKLVLLYCLMLSSVMYVKNIDSYMDQGGYSKSFSLVDYPYVSVFNQEDIFIYRRKSEKVISMYPFDNPTLR